MAEWFFVDVWSVTSDKHHPPSHRRLAPAVYRVRRHAQAARRGVDTEEERDAIIEIVLRMADRFVKPKWPIGWELARNALQGWLDQAIDHLPELLN